MIFIGKITEVEEVVFMFGNIENSGLGNITEKNNGSKIPLNCGLAQLVRARN